MIMNQYYSAIDLELINMIHSYALLEDKWEDEEEEKEKEKEKEKGKDKDKAKVNDKEKDKSEKMQKYDEKHDMTMTIN